MIKARRSRIGAAGNLALGAAKSPPSDLSSTAGITYSFAMSTLLDDVQTCLDSSDHRRALEISEPAQYVDSGLSVEDRHRLAALRALAHRRLGQHDQAVVERATEFRLLSESGADEIRKAESLAQSAWDLFKMEQYARSLEAAGRAYLIREERLGIFADPTASALSLCMYSLRQMGRYTDLLAVASDLYERRLESKGSAAESTVDAKRWRDMARELVASQSRAKPTHHASGIAEQVQPGSLTPCGASKSPSHSFTVVSKLVGEAARGASRGLIEGILG